MRYSTSSANGRAISRLPLPDGDIPLSNGGPRRIPVVGVMGSGTHPHTRLARPLGRALAGMRVHLLTGGGRGVMESASRAFFEVAERPGLVIGILPAADATWGRVRVDPGAPPGYPNPWVELAIRTHLDVRYGDGTGVRSRNHVNILTSDVVVALPGSAGTAAEVELAIRYGRPLVLLGDTARSEGLAAPVPAVESVEEAVEFIRGTLRSGSGPGFGRPAAPRPRDTPRR